MRIRNSIKSAPYLRFSSADVDWLNQARFSDITCNEGFSPTNGARAAFLRKVFSYPYVIVSFSLSPSVS